MLYKRLIINGEEYLLAVNQTGQGAPSETTVGAPGVLYMDTDTEKFYKCTAAIDGVYTWKAFETGGSDSGQNSNGLSTTAANLLIEILESALYTDNMTGKIASLKEALASGGSSGGGDTPDVPDTPDEPDEPVVTDDITVSDGIMTIISVGSAITVSDGVMSIA